MVEPVLGADHDQGVVEHRLAVGFHEQRIVEGRERAGHAAHAKVLVLGDLGQPLAVKELVVDRIGRRFEIEVDACRRRRPCTCP